MRRIIYEYLKAGFSILDKQINQSFSEFFNPGEEEAQEINILNIEGDFKAILF